MYPLSLLKIVNMKKFFLVFFLFLLALIPTILLFVKIFEDRIITEFKKQIIDKTDIAIDFEEINFSIIRYFPYSTFTLNKAKIFYSRHNRKDTLLNSYKLYFKIHTINLFKSVYEFPEIVIANATINIKSKLLDTLFKNSKSQNTAYLVETKSIIFKNCFVKYNYDSSFNLNLYTQSSSVSGSFLPRTLSLKLNLNINQLAGHINNYDLKSKKLIGVSALIKQQNDSYLSENGIITKGNLAVGFSFLYNSKTEVLQIKSHAKNISATKFGNEFMEHLKLPIEYGNLSYESFYSINFKSSNTQKLTLSYNFNNILLKGYDNFSILKLKGKTTISNDFKKNHTEIKDFLIRYNGFELTGSSMIKNFPKPFILIDSKIISIGEMSLGNDLFATGKLTGNIKVLLKIDNINALYVNSLKINTIQSDLAFSNFSIKSIGFLKSLSGSLTLNNDLLYVNSSGFLFNEEFTGQFVMANFTNVVFNKTNPFPKITIEMETLNLDSVLILKGEPSNSQNNYELKSKIKKAKYKNLEFKDIEISLIHKDGSYNCSNIKIKAFNGVLNGRFTYSALETNSLIVNGQGLDIQNLFRDFNDFGQAVITSKNISGKVSGKVDMSYKMQTNNRIDRKSIKLVSDIEIENGTLSGVKQLRRISKYININELDSFRFNTIRNKVDIENEVIKIPSMDIAANGLSFQVSGKHHFDGEFTYWLKLNLKELLAKKYLQKNADHSDYERDNKNGLSLFLKIYGNNENYKVGFDKKSSIEQFKSNLNKEGLLLKSILKEEFGLINKKTFLAKDSILKKEENKHDSIYNKKQKKPFKIEWDEIDTTKNNND